MWLPFPFEYTENTCYLPSVSNTHRHTHTLPQALTLNSRDTWVARTFFQHWCGVVSTRSCYSANLTHAYALTWHLVGVVITFLLFYLSVCYTLGLQCYRHNCFSLALRWMEPRAATEILAGGIGVPTSLFSPLSPPPQFRWMFYLLDWVLPTFSVCVCEN